MKTVNEKMKNSLNDNETFAITKLIENGYEAYAVGGCVRDVILDEENNDVDITTSATPEEIVEVFEGFTTLDVGLKHGTVPVIINGEMIEITTFRIDGEYSDSRRPDSVSFTTSLQEDLMRRDFTINSLAYNEEKGIVDLVEGIKDIENKVIRAVGNPEERFNEDALRIMRGLRFAAKLNFSIEKETEKAMFKHKDLLKNISAERLHTEFNKLIMGVNAKNILVKYAEIIAVFIPEIKPMIGFNQQNPNHIYDVWEHSAVVVQNAKADIAHKIAGVFHDIGKPHTFTIDEVKGFGRFFGHAQVSVEITDAIMRRLKYPNKLRERVLNIIEDHDENLSTKPFKIKKAIFEKGVDRFFDMTEFKKADDSAKNPSKLSSYSNYEKIEGIAKEYLSGSPVITHKDLAISPKDIIELGFKGPEIKQALNNVCLLVISGHKNEKESIVSHIKKHGL